ncbi:hypothetical protein [Rhizosphaericola mali]|uniref:Uncharacterized protein n=1 Tax=Rhizosphaericola mali TaxID=2545455 RepID=A0A5P2GBC7_9BACT|nr:hypothetical protein [Rhizosphaericola mali]QES88861.1 hypothetical protein E0W69_009405 [Rhizosphaericola mali]
MIPVIVDILREVTQKTSTKLQGLLQNKPINFLHGHPEEIQDTLIEMTKAFAMDPTQPNKYPLIAVYQDFPEKLGSESAVITKATLPMIVIACLTDNKYKAPKRMEVNFKPLLYPIYEEFIKQLKKSSAILPNEYNEILHTKIDRLYWGTNTAGKTLNDYVDAIEIMNMELRVQRITNSCAHKL